MRNHSKPDSLKTLTNEQLLSRADLLLNTGPENMDVDAFEACLAELQERAPVMVEHTPADTECRLRTEHPELFARAKTLQKRGNKARRMALIAAVLTISLAIGTLAGNLFGNWSLYFDEDDQGNRQVVAETVYGGSELPKDSMYSFNGAFPPVGAGRMHLRFANLQQMETFLGTSLVTHKNLTADHLVCAGTSERALKTVENITYLYRDYHISGYYTLSDGENALWCSFAYTTKAEAPVYNRYSAENEEAHLYSYQLKRLDVTASIVTGLGSGERSDVYFVKDGIAYRITTTADRETLHALLDHLE